MRAAVLLNRGGGAVASDEQASEDVEAALAGAGVAGEIEMVKGGEIAERTRAAVERGDPLLIVAGGDGSVSAAAGELAGTGTRLGILPLGTLNHFAQSRSA